MWINVIPLNTRCSMTNERVFIQSSFDLSVLNSKEHYVTYRNDRYARIVPLDTITHTASNFRFEGDWLVADIVPVNTPAYDAAKLALRNGQCVIGYSGIASYHQDYVKNFELIQLPIIPKPNYLDRYFKHGVKGTP